MVLIAPLALLLPQSHAHSMAAATALFLSAPWRADPRVQVLPEALPPAAGWRLALGALHRPARALVLPLDAPGKRLVALLLPRRPGVAPPEGISNRVYRFLPG